MPSRQPAWIPQATVFVSSFCIMVLELVAGRVVSRHLGSSLYTWTSVIGVVLAGIAVGNWIGGRLADRCPARPTLAGLFLASAATSVLVTVANQVVGDWVFLRSLPWALCVGAHVALVFLVPSVVLGMISPVAAKMALDQGRETGRTIGSVYAWGVVGSIAGTFASGFWLIAAFGTASVIWAVGLVLAAMGLFWAGAARFAWFVVVPVVAAATIGLAPWAWAQSLGERLSLREDIGNEMLFWEESQYSLVRVSQDPDDPSVRNMLLDKLLHSKIDLDAPGELQYPYERVYGAITQRLVGERDSLNTLTIGGGGYVFPRWIEMRWPRSRTEVVEIDPVVTRAAIEAFGLAETNDLIVRHEDGRAFLNRRAREPGGVARWDVVYFDAFNDYSVPYQLTTVACFRAADTNLAPNGAVLLNMIDIFSQGGFLGAMVATLAEVFPNVAVFTEGSPVSHDPDVRRTFILVGWKGDLDLAGLEGAAGPTTPLYRLSPADLANLRARQSRVLTDDWAPVENLLAPVVNASSREIAANLYASRARSAVAGGDTTKALRDVARALSLDPELASAHETAAFLAFRSGDLAGAIPHFRAVIAQRPAEVRARIDLATALARTGRPADGIAELEQVLRIDPGNPVATRNLGVLRRAVGDGP